MIANRFSIGLVVSFAILTGVGLGAYQAIHNRNVAADIARNAKRADIAITVIEGKRWEEVAAQYAKAGITSYDDFRTIMQAHPDYEGTLFPDTYRFFPNTPAQTVVNALRADYTERTAGIQPSASDLVLASIVERESINDADRPTIAGVYANRLRLGMTLGADPSVEYAKDTIAYKAAGYPEGFTFWKPITQADYHGVVSPFNTYQQVGLPPEPICNPGLKSIEAAQSPAQHDYLYFGYKNGKLLLSKTLAEHEAQLR